MLLQQLSATRGLTLPGLATRAGVPEAVVTKIDAGAIRPQPITLRRLAGVLGLEPGHLAAELSAARRQRGRSAGAASGGWR